MTNLLLDEHPLIILPSLAVKIGLNESIFLQQLHYWLLKSTHIIENERWVYNSVTEWQKQFPFWSKDTVKRIIHNLENKGILISGCFNSMKLDKTKWYRIDYEKLSTIGANCPNHEGKISQPIPEITTEITTKENRSSSDDERLASFNKFWEIYPRHQAKKTAQTKWLAKKCHLKEVDILDDIAYRLKNYQPNGWVDRKTGQICDPAYIPLATTYLNQERWEDEEVLI